MRKDIYIENQGKSGIYMLTNKLTNDIYILDNLLIYLEDLKTTLILTIKKVKKVLE